MECVSHKYAAMSADTVIDQPREPLITLMFFRYKHLSTPIERLENNKTFFFV